MTTMPRLNVIGFADYQIIAESTAIYPGSGDITSIDGLSYVALGLSGEVGELCNKIKKILRDNNGEITEDHRLDLSAELGDVIWYVSAMATQLGRDLGWVADRNLRKLADRRQRGVLQGSGDDR
jgi:NTP pyrophosphatase (non-canonical NTP hydrolase)